MIEFNGSGISSIGSGVDFHWKGDWSGELKPGMKVEMGVMAKWPGEMLEFVVDRSVLSKE
ncbi:MAG TPA: hypothetical protein VGE67_19620 [Haloferula sp.]